MNALSDFKKAVLIGNSKFPNAITNLPALRCPAADVEALRATLADQERFWFTPIHVLLDATRNEILVSRHS